MAYSAKVLRDSLSPEGVRLTTLELTFPRIVLAEFNTHRVFSRNSASSRAIPVEKMMQRAKDDPFIPIYWGKNQKGMQAEEELTLDVQHLAADEWLTARGHMMASAEEMLRLGIHKQITNRLLEPWLWHTVVVTATEYDNWDGLRISKDAQPEIKRAAEMALDARDQSWPVQLQYGDWHLPLVDDVEQLLAEGLTMLDVIKVCIGRCARVSYLTHDGKRDPKADIELSERLLKSGHMSPFEHAATPMTQLEADKTLSRMTLHNVMVPYLADIKQTFSGNFRGWVQARKLIPHEDNFKAALGTMRDLELPVDE